MKKLQNFTEEKRTEKAILISVQVAETGKKESFWLPLSKAEIKGTDISIDADFWETKLEELKNPKEDNRIIYSSAYEKGEKATKLIIEVQFQEKVQELFLWIPNSKISDLQLEEGEEGEKIYKVTVPNWIWESAYSDVITHQLEFWNKEEARFSADDFKVLSKVV